MATTLGKRSRDNGPSTPAVRSDAYVGMLVFALIAQIVGAAFLWYDVSQYPEKAPPKPQDRPAARQNDTGAPPAAVPPGGAAPAPKG